MGVYFRRINVLISQDNTVEEIIPAWCGLARMITLGWPLLGKCVTGVVVAETPAASGSVALDENLMMG